MAHISGYSGTITFGGVVGVAVFKPTTSELELTEWTLHQETDTFEALAKGESHYTRFATVSRWRGTASFLLQADLDTTTDSYLTIRTTDNASSKMITLTLDTVTGKQWDGSAHLTNMTFDDPLDGPVTVDIEFVGTGTMIST